MGWATGFLGVQRMGDGFVICTEDLNQEESNINPVPLMRVGKNSLSPPGDWFSFAYNRAAPPRFG